jgi:hypothetical protein
MGSFASPNLNVRLPTGLVTEITGRNSFKFGIGMGGRFFADGFWADLILFHFHINVISSVGVSVARSCL